MRRVEAANTQEISYLVSKYNEILAGLKSQIKNILDIYSSEKDMQLRISDLLFKEVFLSKQLAFIIKSLEANTEVAIEFEAVQNILTFIPVLLSECRELVVSCYTGNIPTEVIYHMSYSSNNREAADNTLISVLEDFDSFIVEFLVPEFFPAFTLYTVDLISYHFSALSLISVIN
jgi:hypothetical protein